MEDKAVAVYTKEDMIRFLDFSKSANHKKLVYESRCLLNGMLIESEEILRIWEEHQSKIK